MEFYAKKPEIKIMPSDGGGSIVKLTVTIDPSCTETILESANSLLASDLLTMDIEKAFPKRSKNANAMFWALCEKMATALGVSNDEMYLMLLERYGAANVVTVEEEMADSMEKVLVENYKWIKRLGNVMIEGKRNVQFFCYRGSHTYNTKEMGRLIQGTLDDCKELGIPTDPPSVVNELLENWGKTPV